MSVLEKPADAPSAEDVDDLTCHLYKADELVSVCGVHQDDDPHSQMHFGHGDVSPAFRTSQGPGPVCPQCGALICAECIRIWGDMDTARRAINAFRRST